ncbi:MAG: InlB B-repeat-containing protein, partial [Spirochaetaceae bacterium]|nr:InlB B-repeat-containing protein [Spirochaetaceae bacterium]
MLDFTRIYKYFKLFVVVSLVSFMLSCGGGGGGGGGGGAASGPAGDGEESVAEDETGTATPAPAPAPVLSSNAEMISFTFTQADNPVLSTNLSGNPQTVNDISTVNVYYVYGSQQPSDLTALKPTIEISAGATVSPASGAAQDFTVPVNYTVTAQDGTTKIYTVTVSQRDATQRSITYDLLGGSLNAATPVPELFNVEEAVTLPSGGNVTKPNYYFAGWTEQSGGTAITGWAANTHTEDVTLRAYWKPAPYVENNIIYANGISVTVKDLGGRTMLSFKGENYDEINLCDINRASEYQNLSGYTL